MGDSSICSISGVLRLSLETHVVGYIPLIEYIHSYVNCASLLESVVCKFGQNMHI